jgi:hypothetical protein
MKRSRILVFLTLLASVPAFGCICIPPLTPCSWYASHHGQPAFVGLAIAAETVLDFFRDNAENAHPVHVQKVTFQVEEAFQDMPDKLVSVYGMGTTCDYHFEVGTRYLVYGGRGKDGRIRTGKCTRTAPLSEAAEDITFLRSLPNRAGGSIIGRVRFANPQEQRKVIAGTVTASGRDGDHKARVKASGDYEVTGLPIGVFRLTFTPDGHGTEQVQSKIRIPVNGSCAVTGFLLGNTRTGATGRGHGSSF